MTVISKGNTWPSLGNELPATAGWGAPARAARGRWIAAAGVLASIVVLTAALGRIVAGLGIPPLIEADYAYTFTAADRFYEGHGLTATPPRAPLVPWEWRADWVFLTQWPAGYPLLLAGLRGLLGTTTAQAGVTLGVFSCATAVVGWFVWARRVLPRGLTGTLLAGLVGLASFSPAHLVNPSTDGVFVALTPLVLLAASNVRRARGALLLGVFAGATCWIRYAAVALPGALVLYLLVEVAAMRRLRWPVVAAFVAGAAVPVFALLAVNRIMAGDAPVQEQLNLGQGIGFAVDLGAFGTAWKHFAGQSLYAHRREAGLVFLAALPAIAWLAPAMARASRAELRAFLRQPGTLLGSALVLTTMAFLIAASVFFAGKYNYVGQARYYAAIRPLYFLLFVGPLLAWKHKAIRIVLVVPLLAAGFWFVQQDFARTLRRWAAGAPQATDYGRAARRFLPHSREVFAWLQAQKGEDLAVFSNFHEEIVLETQIPACPTPRDPDQLAAWLRRMAEARGVAPARILFVLDPDNDYRSYYLPPPAQLIEQFQLARPADLPAELAACVFAPTQLGAPDRSLPDATP